MFHIIGPWASNKKVAEGFLTPDSCLFLINNVAYFRQILDAITKACLRGIFFTDCLLNPKGDTPRASGRGTPNARQCARDQWAALRALTARDRRQQRLHCPTDFGPDQEGWR